MIHLFAKAVLRYQFLFRLLEKQSNMKIYEPCFVPNTTLYSQILKMLIQKVNRKTCQIEYI